MRCKGNALNIQITLSFLWIPPDLGGHSSGPYSGMRLQIRWQRHLEEYLQRMRDVECEVMGFDPLTSKGKALCTFASPDAIPSEWLQDGELVELLNGFRVLAVGKIVGL
jgi:hypothetical protein